MGEHATGESIATQRVKARSAATHDVDDRLAVGGARGVDDNPAVEAHDIEGIITAAEDTSVTLPTGYFKIPRPLRSLLHVR